MKKSIFLLIFTLISTLIFAQSIRDELFELPDVIFKEIDSPNEYEKAYVLKIKQPIDHNNPEKGSFYQRAYLSHKGFDQPTVIVTNGYSAPRNRITEVATLLSANQISVEHRYFGKSSPDSLDYNYLNLEQATADLHHITELFKNIYSGKWVSTGISKGGQTTIFYRYFFPEDVDVSIPYVAPINESLEDKRIYTFLDSVGSDDCRQKIKDLQIRLLTEREKVLPLMRWYTYGAQLNFTYLTFEEAFEYAILEFPFSFWQWGGKCDDIPNAENSLEEALYYFVQISGIDFFADRSMKTFASHYYQAGAQMGYYGYDLRDFKELMKALPTDQNPSAIFMPNKMQVAFNNEVVLKTREWLKKEGNGFIYINGNADTWSATAVRPNKKVDSHWFFLAGKDHGAARIRNMNEKERKKLISALEGWLEIKISE